MKQVLKKIAYPLMILIIAASCSSPRYAAAQNDDYYDQDNNYSNSDNSYNNGDYNNDNQGYDQNDNGAYGYDQDQGYNDNDYNDDPGNYYEDPSEVNISVFTDALSPYGTCVVSDSY